MQGKKANTKNPKTNKTDKKNTKKQTTQTRNKLIFTNKAQDGGKGSANRVTEKVVYTRQTAKTLVAYPHDFLTEITAKKNLLRMKHKHE